MLSILRTSAARSLTSKAFSTSSKRADMAKLALIGTLVRDPEVRQTKSEKEYIAYTVATRNRGTAVEGRPSSTFHRILSFQESSLSYLLKYKKGTKVYVEASYELREPEAGADPSSPQGQRQVFLRHETIKMISPPKQAEGEANASESTTEGSSHDGGMGSTYRF